ncbi:MAG: hypothetical protein HYZ28_26770 [Myxococcales bacterium]|nr:hypothetical protein [Myxococcales bacterium]
MRKTFFVAAALASAVLAGCNCGGGLCDRSESLDMAKKAGECGGQSGKVLGPKAQCTQSVTACSGADQAALSSMLDCLEKLPTCTQDQAASWSASRQSCFDRASSISESCKSAVFGGVLPGQDAGPDGGEDAGVDAGRQPMTDGGGAIELIAVADETDFAIAWTARQKGAVAQWEVNSENAIGIRYPEVLVPGARLGLEDRDAGAGVKKGFFVVGLSSTGEVVLGEPEVSDAGRPDAGGCSGPLDCPVDRVCNLGSCQVQACVPPNSDTCPGGYLCNAVTARCVRVFGLDGGVTDAGSALDGGDGRRRPFISEMVTLSTGSPSFGPEVFVSRFPVTRNGPEVVAIDSARQYVAMEQENQLFGHLTVNRGKDFVQNDVLQTFNIDTIGSRVKLVWLPGNRSLLACYNVGLGVRVRRSFDLGRTWPDVLDVSNPDPQDGGTPVLIQDCDLAPWRDNKAIMVTKDGDDLAVRVVTDVPFGVAAPEVAFVSSGADAGNIFNPERAAIATAPEDYVVHVGFTGSRVVATGTDTEVYAVYRDSSSAGVFGQPMRINESSVTPGNPMPQDHVALAVEPKRACQKDADCGAGIGCNLSAKVCSKRRAIAAFGSLESVGALTYSVVYVSLWNPNVKAWGTGSDLSIFAKNSTGTAYLVLPGRQINEGWDAFAPSLATTPSGRVFLSFLAGPERAAAAADYHPYLVGFDFDKDSPLANAKGWYLAPAKRAGTTRAVDPAMGGNAVPPTWGSLAADSQLSVYLGFVEGIGPMSDERNRAVMVSWP